MREAGRVCTAENPRGHQWVAGEAARAPAAGEAPEPPRAAKTVRLDGRKEFCTKVMDGRSNGTGAEGHALAGIWPEFTGRYEAAMASLATYRQKYEVFLKWVAERRHEAERAAPANEGAGGPQSGWRGGGAAEIASMEDVTREVAEEYARFIFKRKATARKDIETLRRIWETMLPDQERNPWRIGLHLRPAQPERPCNYRPLTADEARRFVRAALRCAERAGEEGGCGMHNARCTMGEDGGTRRDARYTGGREKFEDLADAAVFAWHYGMRIGSLAALDWRDLATWRRGWFCHVPPKTRYTKPWPLEIPVVAETRMVLERRAAGAPAKRKAAVPAPLFPALAAEYGRSAANLSVCIKGVFRAAGIADTMKGRAQMHSFRASFITQMDEIGAPSGITDAITGHAPRSMHDMYSHPRPAALRRWLDRAIPDIGEGLSV